MTTKQPEAGSPRGECAQVECPDCDAWVLLAPSEIVDEGMEIGRKAAAEHYGYRATAVIASNRALYGVCPGCGAHIGLVIARVSAAGMPRA